MKISINWIKEYTDVDLDNDELVRRIGSQLGAVETVEDWSVYYDERITVAEITEASDHPDADKLGLYLIKIDSAGETRNLVAGDRTLRPGDKVAYIPPGVNVPVSVKNGEALEITEREIRGRSSQGMLASPREVIFSDDHKGVMKLDTESPVGTSLVDAYGLDDLVVDVENKMFTHRPDLFGILGLAREIAGIQGIKFVSPEWYGLETKDVFSSTVNTVETMTVDNKVPKLCPRFTAVVLENVKVGPSPQRIQALLTRVGMRPINNVVDYTNHVMHLTSQPSHAFDLDKFQSLAGDKSKIVIRTASKGEKLKILDGREIEMTEDTVVVATDKQAVSVAGMVGGAETEVDANTTRLLLEVAAWDLYSIRRTSFNLGIFTDAVTRFSKGQSPAQCRIATSLVVGSLVDDGAAEIGSMLVDDYPSGYTKPDPIEFSAEFINTRLGSDFKAQQMADILANTEIECSIQGETIRADVPFWRMDLGIAEDILEEVGRLYGYDELPSAVPSRLSKPNTRSAELRNKALIRRIMSSAGARDIITYNFVSETLFEKAGYGDEELGSAYRIRNAISPDLQFMRIALLPSVVDKVNSNIRSGHEHVALFEINKSHDKTKLDSEKLPIEQTSLAFVIAAKQSLEHSAFYRARAYLDNLCNRLGLIVDYRPFVEGDDGSSVTRSSSRLFVRSRSAGVYIDDNFAGLVGEFSASTKRGFKLPNHSAGFEVDHDLLMMQRRTYRAIPKFPSTTQDVTFETPDAVSYSQLFSAVGSGLAVEDIAIRISPVTVFRSSPSDPRRISFRIVFQSPTRTLQTKDVNAQVSAMVEAVAKIGAKQI